MKNQLNGVIISADNMLAERISGFWADGDAIWSVYASGAEAMECIFASLPDVIIITIELPDMSGLDLLRMLKAENVYRQVPVLLCMQAGEFAAFDSGKIEADDFFILPGDNAELKSRIALAVARAGRNLDANPLTRLPGNTSIINHVQKRIDNKDAFAMCYCDLDFFKSFNDKYGFTRGDEVLLMTARVVVNTVRMVSPADSFVGHVGGDDFIFVVPLALAEQTCQQLIQAFDEIVPQFYDQEDRLKRCIISQDRQGETRTFPLMAISIAVVGNTDGRLTHVAEASSIATTLKKKAKESIQSSYVIDRRQS